MCCVLLGSFFTGVIETSASNQSLSSQKSTILKSEEDSKRDPIQPIDNTIPLAPIELTNKTAQEYVENLLFDNSVSATNISIKGSNSAIASFKNGLSSLGIESGVILSTGDVFSTTSILGYPGDNDLSSMTGKKTNDAVVLEFDFTTKYSTLTFNYIFGSREYPYFVNTAYNDSFGFFVDGINKALIPGTNDVISINTINSVENSQYFIDNTDGHLGQLPGTKFGGITKILPTTISVTPNVSHHIKIVIADTQDYIYDSFIALESSSLRSIGKVNAYFIDEENNTIAPPVFIDGNIGDPYKIDAPTIDGYKFSRWIGEPEGTIGNSITDISAVYKKLTYFPVDFISNGGSNIPSQSVETGKLVTKPTDPTKSGYSFEGWFTDVSLTIPYDFNTPVTSPLTLYAKWNSTSIPTPKKYKVEFISNGGSNVPTQFVNEGELATKPTDPTKDGYIFDGWFIDSGLTQPYDFNTPVTKDIELFAKWKQKNTGIIVNPITKKYKVTFNSNGGTSIPEQIVESGELAIKPTDPTKNGYTFKGWYVDESLSALYDFNTPVTNDITLFAKWDKNVTSITDSNKTISTTNTVNKKLPNTGESSQTKLSIIGMISTVVLMTIVYLKNFIFGRRRS